MRGEKGEDGGPFRSEIKVEELSTRGVDAGADCLQAGGNARRLSGCPPMAEYIKKGGLGKRKRKKGREDQDRKGIKTMKKSSKNGIEQQQ